MKDLYPSRGNEEKIIKRIDKTVYSEIKVGKYSLDEKELKIYEKNGFIILPNIFDEKELKKYKQELKILEKNEKLKQKEEYISEPEDNKLRTIF
ncbi:MAG: hypothetical protein AB7G52_14310, partial [Arcobacter sp.]